MMYVTFAPSKRAHDNVTRTRSYRPPVDIHESDDAYSLNFDLPGFSKEDVKITVKEGVLEVAGERNLDRGKEETRFHHYERQSGAFSRSFRLPDYSDSEKVGAAFDNGVLTVTVPKKEEAKPYSVKIK